MKPVHTPSSRNKTSSGKRKSVLLLLLFSAVLSVNYLTATGNFFGSTQKEISDRYLTLITPGPLAFIIWGIIYMMIFIIIIGGIVKDGTFREFNSKVFPWFCLVLLFNSVWNILFVKDLILPSVFVIILYLLCLLAVNSILRNPEYKPLGFLKISFGIHTGWVISAAVLNMAVYLEKVNSAFSLKTPYAAITVIVILGLASVFAGLYFKNSTFMIPVAWACFNIFLSHRAGTYGMRFPAVQNVSLVLSIILLVFTFYLSLKYTRSL